MNRKFYKWAIALVGLCAVSLCYGASQNIRSDRESECALFLCIPGGFVGSPCSKAHSSMVKRITDVTHHGRHKYTAVPAYKYCKDDPPPEVQANLDKLGVKESNIQAVERMDAHIPEHQECTQFREEWVCESGYGYNKYDTKHCPTHLQKKIRYCVAWKTVPEHYVLNTQCKFNRYNDPAWDGFNSYSSYYYRSEFVFDDKGQKVGSRNLPAWCDKTTHTLGVQVDGKIVGQEARY